MKQSAPRNRASFCWRPATSTAPLTKRPTESTRNGRRGMRPTYKPGSGTDSRLPPTRSELVYLLIAAERAFQEGGSETGSGPNRRQHRPRQPHPHRPIGDLRSDVCGSLPLVNTVVPLQQPVRSCSRVPGPFHGLPRPDQWTGEHQGELGGAQHPTQCVGLAPAEVGEGDVGVPGVFARKAPFGLSVPDQNDFVPGHVVIQSQSEPSRLWVSAGPQLPR